MPVSVKKNKIAFFGNINEESANAFISCLGEVELDKFVEVHISSPGGCMQALRKITDAIENFPLPVVGIIRKTKYYPGVASAASVLCSQLAQTWIMKNATFMIHFSTLGERQQDVDYWVEKTKASWDVIRDLMQNEYEMNAEEASEMSFVDGVL
jgi:ATP-dependent protease ClpP protease subunit